MKDKEHKCKILKDNLRRYKERRIKVVELELTKYELELRSLSRIFYRKFSI